MSHQEVGTEKLYTDKINSLWLQIKEWEGQKTEVYLEINGRVFAERPGHHNLLGFSMSITKNSKSSAVFVRS